MSPTSKARPDTSEAAVWQDLEFGSYRADLPLWEELSRPDEGPVLELGAGSGRVALSLAQRGIAVVALERDADLAAELGRRSRADGLSVIAVHADITELEAHWPQSAAPVGAAIAPLHLIQQMEPEDRPQLLAALARLLPEGARLALVVVDESSLLAAGVGQRRSVPDMREVDGWVYSSEPLWVQVGERELVVRRLRERVSPSGEIERGVHDDVLHRLTPEDLAAEAETAGFAHLERRAISSGPGEADSIAVILEAT